jgi:hypothetical protein
MSQLMLPEESGERLSLLFTLLVLIGLAYQGKDIVFPFIAEYTSLRDFGP